ncbi:MAG: hypothetical protein U0M15_02690 [Bacillota bacterium]|nr:hypothetical protein [Bacillota bacterium]
MKKATAPIIIVFAALLCFSACSNDSTENTTNRQGTSLTVGSEIIASQLMDYSEMLGRSEKDLIAQKGEGEIRVDSKENVASRCYEENVLGFLGSVYYIFSEKDGDLIVKEVMVVFRGVTFNDAVTGISQQLGDAASVEHKETSADAYWNSFHCQYHLAKYENALMLSVKKDS